MHFSISGLEQLQMMPITALFIGLVIGFVFFWPLSRMRARRYFDKEKTNLEAHLHDLEQSRVTLETDNKALMHALEDAKIAQDVQEGRTKAEAARVSVAEEKIAKLTQAEHETSTKAAGLQSDLKRARDEIDSLKKVIETLREKERRLSDLESDHRNLLQDKEDLDQAKREIESHVAHLEDRMREQERRIDEANLSLQTQNAQWEKTTAELSKMTAERNEMSERVRVEMFKRSVAEERLFKVNILERENTDLRAENLELKLLSEKTVYQEKQLEEIKQMHEKAFEDGNARRQEQFANRLFEMKRGLERTVEAFNRTVGFLDQRFQVLEAPTNDGPQPQQPILVGLKTEDAIPVEQPHVEPTKVESPEVTGDALPLSSAPEAETDVNAPAPSDVVSPAPSDSDSNSKSDANPI
ncbi:MAG: hypothetical protein WA705_05675 [Candidatus Ozemobacteraceae bacterium]